LVYLSVDIVRVLFMFGYKSLNFFKYLQLLNKIIKDNFNASISTETSNERNFHSIISQPNPKCTQVHFLQSYKVRPDYFSHIPGGWNCPVWTFDKL